MSFRSLSSNCSMTMSGSLLRRKSEMLAEPDDFLNLFTEIYSPTWSVQVNISVPGGSIAGFSLLKYKIGNSFVVNACDVVSTSDRSSVRCVSGLSAKLSSNFPPNVSAFFFVSCGCFVLVV